MLNIKCFASSSKGNMYLLQNEETKILLECGLSEKDIKNNLRKERLLITDLDCCIVTHIHQDHSLGAEYVLDYIPIYSTSEMCLKYENCLKIEPRIAFKINTIKILPIQVEHGKTENNAFVFLDKDSKIFFGTDFSLMKQNVSNFDFDKVYIECNYEDTLMEDILSSENDDNRKKHIRQLSTHMSKENCLEHLKKFNLSKCKEIVLLHASPFMISKNLTKEIFERELKVKTTFARER